MPTPDSRFTSPQLHADLKRLSAQSERLRIEAKKNAEEAAAIIDKIAVIQRRVMEAEAAARVKGGEGLE